MLKKNDRLKIYSLFIVIFLVIFTTFLYFFKKEICIKGKTMGTTYNIKVVTKLFNSKDHIENLVNSCLKKINYSLSTYDSESEINQFNSITNLKDKLYPSKYFLELLLISKNLYKLTGNVWDPTLDPVINTWGFGREGPKNCTPKPEDLKLLSGKVNFEKAVIFCEDSSIKKGLLGATIDFASIGKGFGVDQIVKLLIKNGFNNFIVEIGGEVFAKGFRRDGHHWLVGINYPVKTSSYNEVYKSMPLCNKAIATSGNYRNFLNIDGKIYSHIIDPRTCYPVSNNIVSVSVIADRCSIADGLATALMILDPEESISLINFLPAVECIIITAELEDGIFTSHVSKGIHLVQ